MPDKVLYRTIPTPNSQITSASTKEKSSAKGNTSKTAATAQKTLSSTSRTPSPENRGEKRGITSPRARSPIDPKKTTEYQRAQGLEEINKKITENYSVYSNLMCCCTEILKKSPESSTSLHLKIIGEVSKIAKPPGSQSTLQEIKQRQEELNAQSIRLKNLKSEVDQLIQSLTSEKPSPIEKPNEKQLELLAFYSKLYEQTKKKYNQHYSLFSRVGQVAESLKTIGEDILNSSNEKLVADIKANKLLTEKEIKDRVKGIDAQFNEGLPAIYHIF